MQIFSCTGFLLELMICLFIIFRYDPLHDSYHLDMEGNGVICSAVDILPAEFAKEVNIVIQLFSFFFIYIIFPYVQYISISNFVLTFNFHHLN